MSEIWMSLCVIFGSLSLMFALIMWGAKQQQEEKEQEHRHKMEELEMQLRLQSIDKLDSNS